MAAERYFNEQSCDLSTPSDRTATSAAASVMNELAGLYTYRNDFEHAATLFRAALDIDRQAPRQRSSAASASTC